MKKVNSIFFLVFSIALVVLDVYKAAHASFTHDESYTYLHYVNLGFMDIISYRHPFPNNHILNTLLMKLFESLFGTSELILRLPNILAHLLYLVFTFKLFSRFCNERFIIPFFILANANPYLIDFFSLARGYGIAIAMMTVGLYNYCCYLETGLKRCHIWSLIFLMLASLASFTLINVFLILILAHNYFELFSDGQSFSFSKVWKVNKENITALVCISIILYEPFRKIIKFHLIDFGGVDGFWHDTVDSIVRTFSYAASYSTMLETVLKVFVILLSSVFIFRIISFYRNKIFGLKRRLVFFFGIIVVLIVLFCVIQHALLGTPFLMARYALFIYPLFIFMNCFLLSKIGDNYNKYITGIAAFFISSLFLLHCLFSINTNYYYEWRYDMDTKRMLANLEEARTPKNASIAMGISWTYEPTINFYRNIHHLTWLCEVDRNGFKADDDYYYTDSSDLKDIPKTESTLIRNYPMSGNYLFKHSKPF